MVLGLNYSQKWLVVLGKASGKGSMIISLVETGKEMIFRGYRLLWSLQTTCTQNIKRI